MIHRSVTGTAGCSARNAELEDSPGVGLEVMKSVGLLCNFSAVVLAIVGVVGKRFAVIADHRSSWRVGACEDGGGVGTLVDVMSQ